MAPLSFESPFSQLPQRFGAMPLADRVEVLEHLRPDDWRILRQTLYCAIL